MIEINNEWRSTVAQTAVDAFAAEAFGPDHGEANATVIGDLLCDIMHLLAREGLDPAHCVGKAYRCFREEVREEEEAAEAEEAAEVAEEEERQRRDCSVVD